MIRSRNRKDPSERDLVALADGSLSAARRARVERAVAASPELKAQISDQRRVLAALQSVGSEPIPGALRAQLELSRRPDPAPRRWYRAAATGVTGAVAAGALASAVVLGLGGGVSGGPTVAAAATLGLKVPVSTTGSTVPGVKAAGIAFPDWSYRFALSASGVRHDSLSGRPATTVFYAGGGQRIAYTIVSGSPIPAGASTTTSTWAGFRLRSFSSGNRAVVTWLRDGHTCVLSGPRPLLKQMLRLAAWRGESSPEAARHIVARAQYLG